MLSETLFNQLSLMNIGIAILEYASAIREGKKHWFNDLVIQYI